MNADDPIEAYLDDLHHAARNLPARQARELLAEAQAHLRDAADEQVRAGLDPHAAAAIAVARFGEARAIADADPHDGRWAVLGQIGVTGVLLAAVAAIGVGVSGLIAAVIRAVAGDLAVAGPTAGQSLTAGDCARWLSLDPQAATCRGAAAADWANETIYYRLAFAVLGILALVVYALLRRRRRPQPRTVVLVTDSVATAVWLLAAVVTFALGIDAMAVGNGFGAGQWLSATPVPAVAAIFYGRRLVRSLGRVPVPG